MKIGIIQENPIVGDVEGNLNIALKSIEKMKKERPDIVVFSEMFLTGYPPEDLLLRDDLFQSIDLTLKELAKHYPELHIVIGYPRKKNKKIFNAAGCIYQGEIKAEYFKQELPNYKVFDEKRYFSPGKGPCLITVKNKTLALTICEDIWYSKAVRQATRRGAEVILNLNASPFHRHKLKERKSLLIKHAEKFSVPIIYVNQVGGQDELVFDGSSVVVSPGSEVDFQLPSFQTATAILNFELKNGVCKLINKTNNRIRQQTHHPRSGWWRYSYQCR